MLLIENIRRDAGTMPWYEEVEREAESWSFILMGYGKCIYWVRGEKLLLEKGDVLLLPPGVIYYGKSIPSLSHEKYVTTFGAGECGAPPLPLLSSDQPLRWRCAGWELLLGRARAMEEEWKEASPYKDVLCGALLLESLTRLNREYDKGQRTGLRHGQAELMTAYLRNHYREKVTKEDLGTVIGRSPGHAAVLFREATGQTISEYAHGLRIKTAVYLLRHSDLTVADIAEQLGYCDPSFFHRTFKRLTGAPPSRYLKEREAPLK
ncbi:MULTISPECIES: AraC family transcriptional regulator [Paenibacillus]|uniref:AraC family transcriptional regulator n=1 Tax=Paenibacillus TaxID=44249 RepID=UPI0022B8D8B0|nr:helix-turn-helix domain-containing protein [Paenibacillus caseinilyticus]MCZ8523253.1 helix-turn-helix domain-containing protein [Paenibacillus caseinilyticus]